MGELRHIHGLAQAPVPAGGAVVGAPVVSDEDTTAGGFETAAGGLETTAGEAVELAREDALAALAWNVATVPAAANTAKKSIAKRVTVRRRRWGGASLPVCSFPARGRFTSGCSAGASACALACSLSFGGGAALSTVGCSLPPSCDDVALKMLAPPRIGDRASIAPIKRGGKQVGQLRTEPSKTEQRSAVWGVQPSQAKAHTS